MTARCREEGGAPARPQGNGGASAGAAPQSFAPRYEAPRGSPRSSAAVSPRIADDPVAQADSPAAVPTLSIGSFEQLIALAQEKRDITTKMALERDVRALLANRHVTSP